jgi:hypothetical protein
MPMEPYSIRNPYLTTEELNFAGRDLLNLDPPNPKARRQRRDGARVVWNRGRTV